MSKNKKKKTASPKLENINIEEIIDYYKDKQSPDIEAQLSHDIKTEEPKQENSESKTDKNAVFLNELTFYLAAVLIAVCAIASAFHIGTKSNSDDEAIAGITKNLRAGDIEYNDSVLKNKELNDKLTALSAESLAIKEREGTVKDFETTKESLDKKLNSLKQEAKKLNDELYEKRQRLKASKENNSDEYSVTLTPGVYTVGKNLPYGTYNVSSEGSIIASTPARETKINEQLSSDKPISLRLETDYTIKINKKTVFKLIEQ